LWAKSLSAIDEAARARDPPCPRSGAAWRMCICTLRLRPGRDGVSGTRECAERSRAAGSCGERGMEGRDRAGMWRGQAWDVQGDAGAVSCRAPTLTTGGHREAHCSRAMGGRTRPFLGLVLRGTSAGGSVAAGPLARRYGASVCKRLAMLGSPQAASASARGDPCPRGAEALHPPATLPGNT